jgi:hypothetical protein
MAFYSRAMITTFSFRTRTSTISPFSTTQGRYEDPELGFCILGHVHHDAKGSTPHDHGPPRRSTVSPAGETVMTDYFPVARPGEGQPGKAQVDPGITS